MTDEEIRGLTSGDAGALLGNASVWIAWILDALVKNGIVTPDEAKGFAAQIENALEDT